MVLSLNSRLETNQEEKEGASGRQLPVRFCLVLSSGRSVLSSDRAQQRCLGKITFGLTLVGHRRHADHSILGLRGPQITMRARTLHVRQQLEPSVNCLPPGRSKPIGNFLPNTTRGPSWGHSNVVFGAVVSFLEPLCGHLSPKIDKAS